MDWLHFAFWYLLFFVVGWVAVRWYMRWRRYTVFIMSVPIKRDK